MHSNRARSQEELLTEDSASSEDSSITTLLINGLKYLRQTTLHFIRRRRVRQVLVLFSSVSNTAPEVPRTVELLGSTAYVVRGLAALTLGFEELRQIDLEAKDENENTLPRIVELDDNGQELPLRPQMNRRRRAHSGVDEAFLANLLNTVASVDPLLSLRSLASLGSSGLRPSPVALQRSRSFDFLGQLVRASSLVSSFSDAMLLVSRDARQDHNSLSQIIGTIALSMMMAEFLMASNLMPTFQQRAVDGLNYLDATLSGQRNRPQAPNQQQFFAPNYYRPALPRPLPPLPRNEQRLNAVNFPSDLVPEEFTCALMSTVMDTPVRLPGTGQVCEALNILEAHARKPENPFNRQPMDREGPNGPQPELALKK